MRNLDYLKQLIILIVWVFVVGAIFSLIAEKQVAGVVAGSGFILIPTLILFAELNKSHKFVFHVLSTGAFLVFSALPIFILRITNWGIDFKELTLFGLSSDFLHRTSNFLYMIMGVTTVICFFIERKKHKLAK